jgi:hypothetical protein
MLRFDLSKIKCVNKSSQKNKIMKKKFTLISAFLLACASLQAVTLQVPAQYPSIQAGINAAVNGDTVLVEPNNTYVENVDFTGKDITVRTPNPLADRLNTIIDGNASGSVVKFISNETNNAKLEGFTLRNGSGTVRDWSYYLPMTVLSGGGILCDSPIAFGGSSASGSSPVLTYLIIENNSAEIGGGIAVWKYSFPEISHVIIRYNSCTNAGGGIAYFEMFNTGGPLLTLTNAEITHNTGGVNGGSGVLVNYTTKLTMMNCTVSDNTGPVISGEALFRANGAIFEIHNCIFWGITSDLLYDQGGAGAISTVDYSDAPNTFGPLTAGAGMINAGPAFVNASLNDYHLTGTSPCINAGTLPGSPPDDLENMPRIGNPDLGAYEFNTTSIAENFNLQISMGPNPAEKDLIIYTKQRLVIHVTEPGGRLVKTFTSNAGISTIVDISELSRGIYLFCAEGKAAAKKIVKL